MAAWPEDWWSGEGLEDQPGPALCADPSWKMAARHLYSDAMKPGIFSSPRKAWIAVALYTVFLYSTLTLSFNLYVSLFDRMGRDFMDGLMSWMYLPLGLILILLIFFFFPRRIGAYVAFLLITLAFICCLQFLTVPAKRFHFLQYAPLTVLLFDALRFHCHDRYHYVWTLLIVALLGLGDETVQGILPDRHFGVADVVLNSVAGLLTLSFLGFVVGDENYPWGRCSDKRSPHGAASVESAAGKDL